MLLISALFCCFLIARWDLLCFLAAKTTPAFPHFSSFLGFDTPEGNLPKSLNQTSPIKVTSKKLFPKLHLRSNQIQHSTHFTNLLLGLKESSRPVLMQNKIMFFFSIFFIIDFKFPPFSIVFLFLTLVVLQQQVFFSSFVLFFHLFFWHETIAPMKWVFF